MERYWLIGGGGILAILLAASIVLSIARGEAEFDPGTPESAVQQYVRALVDGDFEVAEALWSPDLSEDCSFQLFALESRRDLDSISEARITLKETRLVGDTTVVTVGVVRSSGGGKFGPSEYETSYDFGLRQFDSEWLLLGHTWLGNRCTRSPLVSDPAPSRGGN